MIPIPYKLNFTWYDKNEPDLFNQENLINDYDNTKPPINNFDLKVLSLHSNAIASIKSDPSTGLDFEFEITNVNRINKNNYDEYVCENGILGPISTNQLKHITQYIKFDSDFIIFNTFDSDSDLKMMEINQVNLTNSKQSDYLDIFINKWNDDRKYFESVLPQIYFYGTIVDTQGKFLSHYYISKKYNTIKEFENHYQFDNTIEYFKNMLEFLDRLLTHKYIWRNFNAGSIGYEITMSLNSKPTPNVKILKYTPFTLVNLQGDFFKKFKEIRCGGKICVGDIIPYYVVKDYYDLQPNWLERLDKSYSLGLVEIILILFYNQDLNSSKLHKFITEPSLLESKMQYFHIYNRYNNFNNLGNLNTIVSNLIPRYCNLNPLIENALTDITLELLDWNYERIPYPNQMLEKIKHIEKSNGDFSIIFLPIKKNYTYSILNKPNDKEKKNIILRDSLLSNTNEQTQVKNQFNKIEPIGAIGPNKQNFETSNPDYYKLYLKYKSKYFKLKQKKNYIKLTKN